MNNLALRQLIRLMIESEDKEEKREDLLTEPDLPETEEEQTEASVVGAAGGTAPSGALRGATAPLGSGSTSSDTKKKKSSKKKSTVRSRSFGGAEE